MKEIKAFIDTYAALLPVGKSISFTEAEKRAGDFLMCMARITDWRHVLNEDKIRLLTNQTAVYAEEMSKGTASTVTVNKMNAEASASYIEAREELERIENDLSYLKAYFDIFNNAHVFFRKMSAGDNV